MREPNLGLLDAALDRRGACRLGRAGQRNVALAGQQARRRIEADPARAGQIDFAPGMEIGEVVRRTLGSFEGLLVGRELDQVTGGEARGEAQIAQDHHQQPARVAARALADSERLLACLHARFEAHDVGDVFLQPRVQPDDEVDRALLLAIDLRQPLLHQRTHRLELAERRDLLGKLGIVGEGPFLGGGLEEEVEGVGHGHVGHEIDRDFELGRALGDHQAGEMVALRVLLPVEEVFLRLDLERIGQHRRAGMRRGPQAHDLGTQHHRPVVQVGRPMMQRDVNAHCRPLGFRSLVHLASDMPVSKRL